MGFLQKKNILLKMKKIINHCCILCRGELSSFSTASDRHKIFQVEEGNLDQWECLLLIYPL